MSATNASPPSGATVTALSSIPPCVHNATATCLQCKQKQLMACQQNVLNSHFGRNLSQNQDPDYILHRDPPIRASSTVDLTNATTVTQKRATSKSSKTVTWDTPPSPPLPVNDNSTTSTTEPPKPKKAKKDNKTGRAYCFTVNNPAALPGKFMPFILMNRYNIPMCPIHLFTR